MTQQAENGIIDLFRERLASPFIFTYFWVSCTWNWKAIYWFIYEPLKPSLKLQKIPFEWLFCEPLFIAIAIVIFVPWINNGVEFLKRFAENKYNEWLHNHNWKEMISFEEHSRSIEEIANLKSKVYKLANDNEDVKSKENELREKLSQSQLQISKHLESINKNQILIRDLKIDLAKSEQDISESDQKIKSLENDNWSLFNDADTKDRLNKEISAKNKNLESKIIKLKEQKITLETAVLKLNESKNLLNMGTAEPSKLDPHLTNALRKHFNEVQSALEVVDRAIEKM